jgi:hypothetical protein
MKASSISATIPSTVSTIFPIGPSVEMAGSSTRREAPFLVELVNEIKDIARRAPEPVELDTHQHVAVADEFQLRRQLIATVPAVAGNFLLTDNLAAGAL